MRALAATGYTREELEPGERGSRELNEVFGAIRTSEPEPTGNPGVLVPYAATWIAAGALDKRIEAGKSLWPKTGLYRSTRTAIDDASGTADHQKLFSQCLVAPGAQFRLRIAVLRPVADFTNDVAGKALAKLLATLQHGAFSVGRGRGDGHGSLKLVEIELCRAIKIEPETADVIEADRLGELRDAVEDAEPYQPWQRIFTLALESEDAFLVKVEDPKPLPKKKKARASEDEDDAVGKATENAIRALRDGAGLPELPGPSLMGALRARAQWHYQREAMRKDATGAALLAPAEETNWPPKHPINRLFGLEAESVKAMRQLGIEGAKTGWAGMLRLVSIVSNAASTAVLPSVRIDRFSAAPFDKGLFETDAFVRPTFTVKLALDRRASKDDFEFTDRFLSSLTTGPGRGLMLGHGGNHGFGWFQVQREKDRAQ